MDSYNLNSLQAVGGYLGLTEQSTFNDEYYTCFSNWSGWGMPLSLRVCTCLENLNLENSEVLKSFIDSRDSRYNDELGSNFDDSFDLSDEKKSLTSSDYYGKRFTSASYIKLPYLHTGESKWYLLPGTRPTFTTRAWSSSLVNMTSGTVRISWDGMDSAYIYVTYTIEGSSAKTVMLAPKDFGCSVLPLSIIVHAQAPGGGGAGGGAYGSFGGGGGGGGASGFIVLDRRISGSYFIQLGKPGIGGSSAKAGTSGGPIYIYKGTSDAGELVCSLNGGNGGTANNPGTGGALVNGTNNLPICLGLQGTDYLTDVISGQKGGDAGKSGGSISNSAVLASTNPYIYGAKAYTGADGGIAYTDGPSTIGYSRFSAGGGGGASAIGHGGKSGYKAGYKETFTGENGVLGGGGGGGSNINTSYPLTSTPSMNGGNGGSGFIDIYY